MKEPFQDLFKIEGNRKKVEIGNILIAEPFLEEKCFSRSVIFLVEHHEEGSVGFILNKPMQLDVSELIQELSEIHSPIYFGGPVKGNQLYYIHRCPGIMNALPITHGIYWGGDFREVIRFLQEGKMKENDIRFFVGYCGWEKNQLKQELEEGSWMIGDISQEDFFEALPEEVWECSMRALGGRYRVWANFPKDPILN